MNRINNLAESNFGFNTTEQRIVYLACRQLRSIYMKMNIKSSDIRNSYKDHNFDLIKVYVLNYKNEFNVKGNNNYVVLAEVAEGLDKKEINYLQKDGSYKDVRLGAFKYNKENKCIDIMFNPDLIIDLLALKEVYGSYKYVTINGFKKNASFRLYELFKESATTDMRKFMLGELKLKLGLDATSYPDFYELKRSLLSKSIEEIIALTDITEVGVDIQLEVKKVVAMSFKANLGLPAQNTPQDPLYTVSTEELGRMSLVTGIDLTEEQAEKLVQIVITTISKSNLDVGFYDHLENLKTTGVIYNLI